MVRESVERVRARVDAENAARHASSSSSVVKRRKRKKKRKRKAPRCALQRFPRARAVRTRKSEHIPASCCPRSTGVLDYFWEMTSWLRPCIWQSLVCLSCLWFAWLDSGYIFTSVYRKMFRIQRIVWFDIGYNICVSPQSFLGDDFVEMCVFSACGSTVDTCSRVCYGALGIHHFLREGGYGSRCSHLECGHYLSALYPAVTCPVLAAPEVRVLRSHLARGHYFYHPLLARQWIHVCVSLRRLLEYLTCRARRRHLQWYVLASTGAVLGQGVALAVEAHDDSTGAVLGQGDMPVWSFWSDSAENCGFSAAACHRWSSTSRSWCRGRFLWFYCSVDKEIPQLQFLDEKIDAPVVQVVFLPVVAHDRRP